MKTSQPLTQKPTESEVILLAKIKQLEEQLKQVQAENKKLKIGKEKAEQELKNFSDEYERQHSETRM